jgi:2'-5' RNA ligase
MRILEVILCTQPMFKKYFIAIVLPEPVLNEVEVVKQQLHEQFGLKGALRSPAHITLHRPFEWKEEKEQQLIEKLKCFDVGNSFLLELNNYNCFSPRVIYVDVMHEPKLFAMQKELKYFAQKELGLLNEVNDLRGFHPHVTVAFRDLRKNKFNSIWETFKNREYRAEIEVKGFSLLKLNQKWEVIENFYKKSGD